MKTFTFSALNKIGDYDEKFGQTYIGYPNEQLQPVMFNSMDRNISQNDRITAENIELKTFNSGKNQGKEYHRLKKVHVDKANASTSPQESSDNTELLELAKDNNRMLKILTGENDTTEVTTPDTGDEPINLDDIPF